MSSDRKAATDMEYAQFMSAHIHKPCTALVKTGDITTARPIYLRLIRRELSQITDPAARAILENLLEQYGDEID